MRVDNLKLINFRNYNDIYVEFSPNTNILIGKNAQGKTNLLEAIYICSQGRSFRTNRDSEIISQGKEAGYIGANMFVDNFRKLIEIKMSTGSSKRIMINKTELKNYKELNTGLNVVVFSPEDLRLIKDGPSERRKFLDTEISQIRPVYSYNIDRYNKVLNQRNNLLKSSGHIDRGLLDIFNIQMVKLGTEIVLDRKKYIKRLLEISKKTHGKITNFSEDIDFTYTSNVDILENKEAMEAEYLRKLNYYSKRDIERRTSLIGPHRDDILSYINDKEVKVFGSQGQIRTLVLSIKLSEVELIKEERGSYPVLLLDDVFSELDNFRKSYLVDSLKDIQTIITTTDLTDLRGLDMKNSRVYRVDDGKITSGSSHDNSYRK